MKTRFVPLSVCSTALLLLGLGVHFCYAQVRPTHRPDVPDFDQRNPAAETAERSAQRAHGKAHLETLLPSASVDFDRLIGSPSFIHARDGFLTGTHGQGRAVSEQTARRFAASDPDLPVKAFLDEHAGIFGHGSEALAGAKISSDSVGKHNHLRTVSWQQNLDGIPVFESVLIANISQNGELVSLSSRLIANAAASAGNNRQGLAAHPPVSAEQALVNAAQNLGEALAVSDIRGEQSADAAGFREFSTRNSAAYARLVWLPMNRSAMRLTWEVMLSSQASHERFQFLVDAQNGQVIIRRAMTRYISDVTYDVYTSDSPSPFSPGNQTPSAFQPPLVNRTLVTIAALDPVASPNGWINDGDNTTSGNNAETFLDRNFDFQPDSPSPQGNPPRVFDFPLDLTQDPLTYSNAAIVQLFYWLNWYHDKVYDLGFTESAGNYQIDNFGRGGLGNDNIIGYVQSGADVGIANNAFFIPAPDGVNGQIAMFVWDGPNPARDGDLDAEVILHEATHGTSERLVGGGVLITALQTAGMGEGWSDFYGLSLLSQAGDDPDAAYAAGGYASFRLFGLTENYYYGIRHYPYSTDLNKNPFTFKDIDPAQISPHTGVPLSPIYPFFPAEADEVHHQGEVWCVTLWDVRANLIHKYGSAGNQLMLQLVTDGMKLGPANPNFLQARDAIILADQVDNGGANFLDIWTGFAKRGMGVSAASPPSSTTSGVIEAYDLPGLNVAKIFISGGNGNGVIDFNECNDVFISLVNNSVGAATGISATLSSTTPGVTIAQSVSTYPDIPRAATNANTTPFKISTAPGFICGTPVLCTFQLKTDQLTATNQLILTSGTNGAARRFDSAGPVAIPDNYPPGTNSFITVSNISGALTKATVSLYITHTFDSDLTLQLVGPDGTTNTLSAHKGGAGDNYGINCSPDSQRTTFDDAAPLPIASGGPPYVGSFQPQQRLAVFAGKSGTNINGIWTLHVVDSVAVDTGIIQCWSLNLAAAGCIDGGGECPGSDLAIGMTASPEPVIIGNNLTYTISVTNKGPSTANSVVVSHVLPPGVIFVSATASQGGCSQAGGVVTCSLGKIDPGAKATVTVVVTPASTGTVSSTASVSSEKPDFDTSNNTVTLQSHINPPTSDLLVSFTDAPDPVVIGATLTYSLLVSNGGPNTATGVIVTNALPASVVILGSTVSQGSVSSSGNTVLCTFGTLAVGGFATATINVSPTVTGLISSTATAVANQFDPTPSNSTVTVTTSVGPSADLTVSVVDSPDPVVLRSNLTYVVSVTNRGPSGATGVSVANNLDSSVVLLSTNASAGTVSVSGSTVNWALGNMASGASASMTMVVSPTNLGTISMNSAISANENDPNLANNVATASTLVAAPFVSIVPAGATLTVEGFSPPDGSIDVGETVTVSLRLRNAGNVRNTNLVATLLTTNGVTPVPPNNPQTYGVLAPSGFPVGRSFSFTAGGTNGGTVTATLQLQDGAANIGLAYFTFVLPTVRTFANTNLITIRDATNALPYPSTLTVSGITSIVGKVTVTLSNISHTFPQDIDALVVGPGAQSTILMSGAGAPPLANANVTFDDGAASQVPDGSAQIATGSYRPADYLPDHSLLPPAPAGPYAASMSALNSGDPNGTWSLFVDDHSGGDSGNIQGGWSLALTLVTPVNQVADLGLSGGASANPAVAGSPLIYTFTVTNTGPNNASFVVFTNVLSPAVTYVSASSSQGTTGTNAAGVFASLGSLGVGSSVTVTITVVPAAGSGVLTNVASVTASENDFNPANNMVTLFTSRTVPVADAGITQTAAPNPVIVGSNLTYSVAVTNVGPGTALDVVVTDPLPAGAGFTSATPSVGTTTNVSGTVTWRPGNLAAGASANLTIVVVPGLAGGVTNTVTVSTSSSDTNSANNSATAGVVAANPAPQIIPAGVVLTAESGPVNASIDRGETVTLSLSLANVGSANAANLTATLQATGGVTPVGNTQQTYGQLIRNGPSVSRSFSFTATSANVSQIVVTLQLVDGANSLGTVAFTFPFPVTSSYANGAAITIPDHGAGLPYPSTINVSGQTGSVSKATVTLYGLTHSFPRDVNVLLTSPAGGNVLLMSHAGGSHALTNVTLMFDDSVPTFLPSSTQISSTTNKPSIYPGGVVFPAPAPGVPYGSLLSSVNGGSPNGIWSLFVLDDALGDSGMIANGWSLGLTTSTILPIQPKLSGSVSNGYFQITLTGEPLVSYVFQASTNLVSWSSISTNTTGGTATLTYTDTSSPGYRARYYRAVRIGP